MTLHARCREFKLGKSICRRIRLLSSGPDSSDAEHAYWQMTYLRAAQHRALAGPWDLTMIQKESREQQAEIREQRAKSRESRAESGDQLAENREQRAKIREQRE